MSADEKLFNNEARVFNVNTEADAIAAEIGKRLANFAKIDPTKIQAAVVMVMYKEDADLDADGVSVLLGNPDDLGMMLLTGMSKLGGMAHDIDEAHREKADETAH